MHRHLRERPPSPDACNEVMRGMTGRVPLEKPPPRWEYVKPQPAFA